MKFPWKHYSKLTREEEIERFKVIQLIYFISGALTTWLIVWLLKI